MSWNLKTQVKTTSFWLGLASAIFLLVQAIGEPLGLKISEANYMSIVNALLGVFVVLGILSNPASIQQDKDLQSDIAKQGKEQ